MDRQSPLETASAIILSMIYGILPLIILPITDDPVGHAKQVVLTILMIITLLFWLTRLIFRGETVINRSPIALSIIPITILLWVYAMFFSTNRMDAILSVSGPLTVSGVMVFLVLGLSFRNSNFRELRRWIFMGIAAVTGVIVVYQTIGVTASLAKNLGLSGDTGTTPIGPLPVALAFLIIALPIASGKTIRSLKTSKNEAVTAISGILTILIAAGVVSSIISIVRDPPQILPFGFGWSILLESAKSIHNLFLGVGLERFFAAFMLYRPVEFNVSPLWTISFNHSSNLIFDLVTTTGIIGLGVFIWMLRELGIFLYRNRTSSEGWTDLIAYIFFVVALFFVAPVAGVWIIFLLLSGTLDQPKILSLKTRIPGVILLTIFIMSAVVTLSYGLYRFEGGQIAIKRAAKAIDLGNSTQAYGYAVQATHFMPTDERYRIITSQLSMNLGQGLLTNVLNGATSSATQADQKTANSLINQSIREARTAILLSPDNAYVWTNLASLYQNMVGLAQNADQYGLAAYRNAIRLDPQNPVLRLDLGNLYVTLKQYDQASAQFLAALTLKPDYANAEYNLANLFVKKGDYDNALKALEQTRKMTAKYPDSIAKIDQMESNITKLQQTVPITELSPTPLPRR